MKKRLFILTLILSILTTTLFSSIIFAEGNSLSNFDKQFRKKYDKYLEDIKAAKTGEEQRQIRDKFYKSINAKVKQKKVTILKKNESGKYYVLQDYTVTGDNLTVNKDKSYYTVATEYVPGDIRIQVLYSGVLTDYEFDKVENHIFKDLIGVGIGIVVGEVAPAIGVATSVIGALVPETSNIYYADTGVYSSHDKTLCEKIVEVYTDSGDWYTYVTSYRLETYLHCVAKVWNDETHRYDPYPKNYGLIKYEEGEHYNDETYLRNLAYDRWLNNMSAWSEAYYTGPVWVNQAVMQEFEDWAGRY